MKEVVSFISDLHPLSFMGYHVLSTTVIYILVIIIISLTRPSEKGTPVPPPYSIPPSFLAWLHNKATSIIQLAMFRLLRKNYVTIIHSAQGIELCANQQFAECKMTCVEKILFDHFSTPKPSDKDLPITLYVAEKNHWSADTRCAGLMLGTTQQTWNMILVAVPSIFLIAILGWKTLFDNDALLNSSVFSWLVMFVVSGLWWLLLLFITINATRMDREGISINILRSYVDKLKDTLIADKEQITDETADYCVAIGKTNLLPERYREYQEIIRPVNYPFSIQRLD
ncbi:hypothetical protein HV213_11865 [Klebsiella sp. RHBSTW-00484]|uniref:hypothetical protein n=1 Tax=unclassified Klebsiella TaxID=2608929 RepID=UPI0015E52621|nr:MULTISPECIES: hypothetical protein [unclassified Klebsiella]MBA7847654.1 hypothetical protein [Klebsiella sp. RHBSTW-00465]QLO36473.1 hypothetical protein HV213_11865 [Klebsiella sp. RHBSTW-00484]QLT75991.1 hypothetical protein HV204_11865 [Klebsiella sp. RHBSTW-00464]